MTRTALMVCLVAALGVNGMQGAWAAGERPPPGARPQMSPWDVPPPNPTPREPSELDILAGKEYRPSWAPLPMFRGEIAMVPFLHDLLGNQDPVIRARSAFLLGQIACPNSVGLLVERLKDADRSVRVQSGIALACMGDARGIPVCAAVLEADPPWVRFYAAYGLWCVNSSRARGILRESLPGQGELVTEAIEGALKAPYVAPPAVARLSPDVKVSPRPSPEQTWEQAADVLTKESDWWWHGGDYDQVIRCHEASILLDPDYAEAYSVTAWLEWSMGRDSAAISTLRRGVAAAPKDPDTHFNLGFHYFNTKRYAQAEAPLARAVKLGGDHLAQRTYAHCLEKLEKLDESLAQWLALLEKRPTDGAARLNRDRLRKIIRGEGGGD